MPIQYDKAPGSAKRHQRTRDGRLTSSVTVPDPAGPDSAPATIRVRMLQSVRSKVGTFREGQTVELPAVTARSWIGFGLAEQDKMILSAPEIK